MTKIFNPRRSTAIGLGGISPVMGGAVGGLFGGNDKKPRYTQLPTGRTIVKGGMDTQGPIAAGAPATVTMKDKAALAAIQAGAIQPGPAPTVPQQGGFGGLGGMLGAAMQRRMQPQPYGRPTGYTFLGGGPQGRIAGYADGGKVVNRKPNGKRC